MSLYFIILFCYFFDFFQLFLFFFMIDVFFKMTKFQSSCFKNLSSQVKL
jgi:hypothetical protein